MEGDTSSGSLLHKLLASPRFVRRESQQQAEEIAVLKLFRTLPEEESYTHPTNNGDINNSCDSVVPPTAEIKNDVSSERTDEQLNTENCKGGVLLSSPFPSWRRPFSSSFNVLTDSDVVKVTRVETYSDNENEEEDGGNILPGELKVTEKPLGKYEGPIKQNWDLYNHERESDVSKTDSILPVLTDRSVLELTRGDNMSVPNRMWSNESSDRQQDSSLYLVDNIDHEITSKGLLRDSYLVHNSEGDTNVDTGLDVSAAMDPILREHSYPVVPGDCSGNGQTVSPAMTENSLNVSPYKTEDSLHASPYRTEESESQSTPAPDGNALDSSLLSEKQIFQEDSWGTPMQKKSFTSPESHNSIAVTSPSSAVQLGSNMTKDSILVDQNVSLNNSAPSTIRISQDIKEDMPATKRTTSNPSSTLTSKSIPSTSREAFQMPALFSGLKVLKKGTLGEDRETLSEIKQKDTDQALLSLKQHVNKAKFKQHQASTSTHKKGADPKEGAESKNNWRQMINFDDICKEESPEKRPQDTEGLNTGEKVLAKDTTDDSFKFLSSFKTLVNDSGDVSVDLEAVKRKRKNDRELLKSIFEKSPSKSASIDKSPEEVKVCITQNILTCTDMTKIKNYILE